MLRLPTFEYHRPGTLEQAIRLLDELGEGAMLIAGGTDVIPNMKHRLHEPEHLVALGGVEELRGIDVNEEELRIGATETLSDVAADRAVLEHIPALADAARHIAGPQLRNAGTLGGNLCLDTRCTYYNQSYFWRRSLGFCLKKDGDTCHVTQVGKKCVAAHSADTAPVLWALGARVELVSAAGRREVPVDEFFVADGIHNTVLTRGEVLVGIRIPLPGAGTRMAYSKLRPRDSIDFPVLNAAAVVQLDDEERIRSLRLVVSALGSRPREVTSLDDMVGSALDDRAISAISDRAHKQCRPLTNIIVDPEWRRAMVPVYVRRTLQKLSQPQAASTVPAD